MLKLCIYEYIIMIFGILKYAHENRIFKYLRCFVPFKDDPVTIQTSVFLMRSSLAFNYSVDIF